LEKRYQVFVSSTYADLMKERHKVIQALMEMDCIPAGMELFPAADEEQWEFIKKVIDDCDYYLLIIGGRYGSITDSGISYTEKEFDYAVENGLKVVALVHSEPDEIPFGKSEKDPGLQAKLKAFKNKVMTGRLVKTWNNYNELPGLVALSMTKTIKMYPAVGWVRASAVANEDVLQELNIVRRENAELNSSLKEIGESSQDFRVGLVNIESKFEIAGNYWPKMPGSSGSSKASFAVSASWTDIFAFIAPFLLEHPNDATLNKILASSLLERDGKYGQYERIHDQKWKTITVQLKAYGLVDAKYTQSTNGKMGLFWSLTKKGESLMYDLRTIRDDT
jgi:hypothetical protein